MLDKTAEYPTRMYPDPPAPAPYQPKEWDGPTNVPDGHGSYTNHDPVRKPNVPGGSGGGKKTQVNTASMEQFASNIETLIPYVQRASSALGRVSPAPGAFYHANVMREKVSGNGGDGCLRDAYLKVLTDLANGLTELCHGVRLMNKKYQSIEEANKMSAKDLQDYMYDAGTDLNTLSSNAAGVH
ncbi:hypothetical protein [Streptomyces sp. NPDC006668]|uniref:hypothetical protein n=1 Tax=Streptomyces sp. NPDC006668 TaxID=3156903 RepID=UPI0033CF4267